MTAAAAAVAAATAMIGAAGGRASFVRRVDIDRAHPPVTVEDLDLVSTVLELDVENFAPGALATENVLEGTHLAAAASSQGPILISRLSKSVLSRSRTCLQQYEAKLDNDGYQKANFPRAIQRSSLRFLKQSSYPLAKQGVRCRPDHNGLLYNV